MRFTRVALAYRNMVWEEKVEDGECGAIDPGRHVFTSGIEQ